MDIKIAERFRPFSHIAGTCCVLPGTFLRLQIFPAYLIVHDLSTSEPKRLAEIFVPIKGPVQEFTVQLDLEKNKIQVWGRSEEGYFRYNIRSAQAPFHISIEIEKGLSAWNPVPLSSFSSFMIQPFVSSISLINWTDRLSLGNHKSQDWEMVKRRGDLTEILPIWLRLGQIVHQPSLTAYEGTMELLKICQNASSSDVYKAFLNLFNGAFSGILSPHLTDEQHLGFDLSSPSASLSPLNLLTEGAKVIRSLFIRTHKNQISILPCLPPEFHCGRFVQVCCEGLGLLDFEWSKKMIRRLIFYAEISDTLSFIFPKEIKSFRLNGEFRSAEEPLSVQKGVTYIFDRFQK